MPCKHAVACIQDMTDNGMDVGLPKDRVDPTYRIQTWREQYSFKINLVNGRNLREKTDWRRTLIPPKVHIQIERPPKKIKKSAGEVEGMVKVGMLSRKGLQVIFHLCKGKGHNKRGCKEAQDSASQPSASQAVASQPNASQVAHADGAPSQAASVS